MHHFRKIKKYVINIIVNTEFVKKKLGRNGILQYNIQKYYQVISFLLS